MSLHLKDNSGLSSSDNRLTRTRPLILVVDDHEAARYMKCRLLRQHGFDVIEASTGSDALSLVRARGPELVCLDVRLPDISGFDVCRNIKNDPHTCTIMVLHMSATYMGSEQKVQGLRCGADTYLTEPVEPELLVATIEALLRLQRAEQAVRRSAVEWQTTFDAMGDGLAVIGADDLIVKCNQAFTNIAQKTWDRVVGADLSMLFAPWYHDSGAAILAQVRASGVRQSLSALLHGRHYDVTLEPVGSDGQQSVAVVLIMRDVTQEAAAKQALQRQAHLLDLAHDSIVVRDLDGLISFWNKGAERTYGWTATEALGQCVHTLLGTEFPKPLHEIDAELAQFGYWQGELFHTTRDGRRLVVLSRWVVHHDEEDGRDAILETNTDNTERKQAHDELIELYRRAQVQEQELRHQQEQLVQAGKLATLGEMATGLAHEINNPLNNIGLFIGNALDRLAQGVVDSAPIVASLRQAQEEVMRGANIIKHLRQFGLGESIFRAPEPVHDLIASAMSRVRLQHPAADMRVAVEAAALATVFANRAQLEQALFNILQNAVEAVSASSTKEIWVKTVQQDRAVEIVITDSGAGIPAGMEQRIFDPFFTTKEAGRGTGLGLSIAYSIIKAHGGSITVMSPPGGGATFRIVLPVSLES